MLKLGLEDGADASQTFTTPAEAAALLPALPEEQVLTASTALLAQKALGSPGIQVLLGALRDAALSPQPERELVRLAARWTGGFAEIQASWGDTVASAGRRAGQPASVQETLRLTHAGRHVGSLSVAFPPDWRGLPRIRSAGPPAHGGGGRGAAQGGGEDAGRAAVRAVDGGKRADR